MRYLGLEYVSGTRFGRGRLACVLTAVALVATPAFAAPGDAVEVQVVKDTGTSIVLEYTFGDFTERSVTIDGDEYSQIFLAGGTVMEHAAGAPALPKVCRSVIVPNDGRMAVRVLAAESYEISDIDIAPSKGVLLRTVDPADVPFTFGEVYQADAPYPARLVTLGEPYILRDHRGVVVEVHPFVYNPVARTLRVYTSLKLLVQQVGAGGANVLAAPTPAPSLSFQNIYQTHFVNYDGDRYPPMTEQGDLLIICYDSWIPNVEPLAEHKNAIGINTTIVGISEVGSSSSAVKSYIQSVYDGGSLAFVLLVGDSAQVPTPSASGGASDPSYAKLAGGDDYPDIIVGRFSAENASQVDTQVERTIEYEDLPATEQDWFWKGVGLASSQGTGDDGEYDWEHIDNIRDDLLAYGYTEVDRLYDTVGATAADVSAAVNAGRGIINYCGHGSTSSWSTTGFSSSHVNSLTNDNMLPFIVSVACVNGKFNGTTCFAEAWLRATHGGEPTGAVGMYASSINQSWSPPMEGQDEFNILYVNEDYVTYGALCFAGSCSMMEKYGSDGVKMYNTWHIFGDPSLRVVGTVAPPEGLKVSPSSGLTSEGPNGGPFAPDAITYTLTNYDPAPLDFTVSKGAAWVSLSATAGTIPAEGAAEVTVSINAEATTLPNGHYEDEVVFVNTTTHVGDTTRGVSLEVGVPVPVHVFNLDTDPGWSTSGEWEFGEPQGQGGGSHGYADPSSGATGDNAFGIDLGGDYSTSQGSAQYLTTGALDCSDLTQVSLHFQRWLNADYQPYVTQAVEVSTDGTSWDEIWDNGSSEIAEHAWSEQVYDLSSVADGEPTLYIRWKHQVTSSGAYAYSGWNIDDVEIWGLQSGQPGEPVEPDDYQIIRGTHVAGGLDDLAASDDSHLTVELGFVLSSAEPPVWLVIEGTSPTATPGKLAFTLEAKATSIGLTQKIELYDFDAGEWVELDSTKATPADSVRTVSVPGDPARFIDPDTLRMKAQLTWKANGPVTAYPWEIGMDMVGWTVTP